MLFNSFEFLFAFLPVVLVIYFLLNAMKVFRISDFFLVGCSLFFYAWWNISYLPILLTSLIVNFYMGKYLNHTQLVSKRKIILVFGIFFNVVLLGIFKYLDFFVLNINTILGSNLNLFHLALPLAISFFTFQQIAYLVDCYKYETKKYNFIDYSLFVTFFPQLIAGPIVQHYEVLPQFKKESNRSSNYLNIAKGIVIFTIGLFKKCVIADNFAIYATDGFRTASNLTFIESWITSLSYTFQLYFDFSGYSDMAIGIALLFNITLPINFNSPYKSLNIKEFWKRWHITLGRFLTTYLYIPIGGSKKGGTRTCINLLIIFLVSGFWHGAGWTFILWGALHGIASVIYRIWSNMNLKMSKLFAWFLTFNFVNMTWVLFRASNVEEALYIIKSMIGLNGFALPTNLQYFGDKAIHIGQVLNLRFTPFFIGTGKGILQIVVMIILSLIVTTCINNSSEVLRKFRFTIPNALIITIMFIISILTFTKISEFLYFNF
ncbi:MBOAT family O-acyltransferase [Paenibacillus alvei]|uniref:Peptidoglycan O-acetyltransferase n=1 Tax=Paenibacillus alvei TaxID=44250 RepID=A0A383RIP0_PAEAL|nr:MBOAT family protein [Paenibacillus alvei]SYX86452.1 Peptidoglycan O-acetyltransferase [Paenibacillus alvei]